MSVFAQAATPFHVPASDTSTDDVAGEKSDVRRLDCCDGNRISSVVVFIAVGRRAFHLVTQCSPRPTWLETGTPVTTLIVLLNLLAFVALASDAGWAPQIDVATLIRFGANDRALDEQSWRLLTCAFLHVDPALC